VEGGGYRVEGGGWRVQGGGWRMQDDGCEVWTAGGGAVDEWWRVERKHVLRSV